MQVLHFPFGNVRWCCHHGTQSAVSSQSYTQKLSFDPAIPLPGICPQNICYNKKSTTSIHSGVLTVKNGNTQMSAYR